MYLSKAKKASNKLVRRSSRESKHGSKRRPRTFNHDLKRTLSFPRIKIITQADLRRRAQEGEDEIDFIDPDAIQEDVEEDANSDGSQEEAFADYDEDSSSNDPLVQQEDNVVPPGSPGSNMPPPTPSGTKRTIRVTRIQDQVTSPKRLRLSANPALSHPKAYISTSPPESFEPWSALFSCLLL